MSKATYDSTIPVSGANFSSFNMRNNYQALAQGDSDPLRPRAQASPDMTVGVAGTEVESYYHQVYNDFSEPLEFSTQNSPTVVAPAGDSRIDILVVSGTTASGTLHWVTGAEGATPTLPSIPEEMLPVCAIYCKTTMDRILNYEEKDTDSTEGYLYRDLRPKIVPYDSIWAKTGGVVQLNTAVNINTQSKKFTNLVAGSAPADSIRYDQAMKTGDAAGGGLAGTYPNPTLVQHAASDTQFAAVSGDTRTSNTSYELIFGMRILRGGTIRIKATIQAATAPATGKAKIYKNGVAHGSEIDITVDAMTEYAMGDLAFSAGDTVELWVHRDGATHMAIQDMILYSTLTWTPNNSVDYIFDGAAVDNAPISGYEGPDGTARYLWGVMMVSRRDDTAKKYVDGGWREIIPDWTP